MFLKPPTEPGRLRRGPPTDAMADPKPHLGVEPGRRGLAYRESARRCGFSFASHHVLNSCSGRYLARLNWAG